MIRTKLAKKVLTKKEQKHLSEMGINSMSVFLITRKDQIKMRAEGDAKGHTPGIAEPCFECKEIARKLGVE